MKISFNQPYEKVADKNGFGYAAKMCKESLATLGHDVQWRNPDADVEINFIQPDHWHWSGPKYRIGYLPWESTRLKEGWVETINNEVDELWTPSPVVARWMLSEGVGCPVKIYQHGVDPIWSPIYRAATEARTRFLHHGAEALRKGGNDTISTFFSNFGDKHATLVMKMILQHFNIHNTDSMHIHKTKIPLEELVALYHGVDAMVYPSWGEGFGLVPLQAMATGMPVLITRGWAPYEYLLDDDSLIDSELTESPWQAQHPGKMFKPNLDDFADKWLAMFNDYENYSKRAYDLTSRVSMDYSWLELTRQAFAHLESD